MVKNFLRHTLPLEIYRMIPRFFIKYAVLLDVVFAVLIILIAFLIIRMIRKRKDAKNDSVTSTVTNATNIEKENLSFGETNIGGSIKEFAKKYYKVISMNEANIGRSIKEFAKKYYKVIWCLCVIFGVCLVIPGVVYSLDYYEREIGIPMLVVGIILLIFRKLIAWLSAMPLYAFGEITENTKRIADVVCKVEEKEIVLPQGTIPATTRRRSRSLDDE